MMRQKRRTYTKEFKEDAVNILRGSDKPLTVIASELGIDHSILSRWNREFDDTNAFPGNGKPKDEENYLLKKEIAHLKEEREILKKALAIFSKR